ncbi:MAG TPA: SpoIID/LytB domain-containing protein [Nitrospiria bacterium]
MEPVPFSSVEIHSGSPGLSIQGRATPYSQLAVSSSDGLLQINDLLVRGTAQIFLKGDTLLVVNTLDLEDYLKGVVPVEIAPDWGDAALKAQAVIARTYALYQKQQNGSREYDLLATTADQVYHGRSAERPATDQAVAETRGRILTFGGAPILAAYHSTSAGPTENAASVWGMDLPYLQGVSCPFDAGSPHYRWVKSLPMKVVEERFSAAGYAIGTIAGLSPYQWTPAGRVDRVRILHSGGELLIRAADLRRILGYTEIRSTRFVVEKNGRDLRISGMGSGHGVGLCQWGAKEMAEMGYAFEKILSYYYPGTRLELYGSTPKGKDLP